jgi:hypothetical protein
MTYERFTLDNSAPSLWRVSFNHPPINLIDSVLIEELGRLFEKVETNAGPAVVVFESADPEYFCRITTSPVTTAPGSNRYRLGRPAFTRGSTSWCD